MQRLSSEICSACGPRFRAKWRNILGLTVTVMREVNSILRTFKTGYITVWMHVGSEPHRGHFPKRRICISGGKSAYADRTILRIHPTYICSSLVSNYHHICVVRSWPPNCAQSALPMYVLRKEGRPDPNWLLLQRACSALHSSINLDRMINRYSEYM